jgi:L-iditol 2-dehydrogenase
MRVALLTEARSLAIAEHEEPALSGGEVLIESLAGGICGSDVHTYEGRHPFRVPPVVLGHEISGRVLATAADVDGLSPGDLVTIEPQICCRRCYACRAGSPHLCVNARRPGAGWPGTFAERIVAPAEVVYRLPEGASAEDGALVEPTAVAVRAVRRAGLGFGDTAVVLGAGAIGCLIVAAARATGAQVLLASDPQRFNRDFATSLGAQAAIDPRSEALVDCVAAATRGRGADAVFVACSAPEALLDGVAAARRGGVVVQVALHEQPLRFDATAAVLGEVDVRSSLTYSADDFTKALHLVGSGVVSAELFVTQRYAFGQAPDAFAAIASGLEHVKVLLLF